ncbi:hypothetical protein ACLKA6_018961 [Drosophila palustris]
MRFVGLLLTGNWLHASVLCLKINELTGLRATGRPRVATLFAKLIPSNLLQSQNFRKDLKQDDLRASSCRRITPHVSASASVSLFYPPPSPCSSNNNNKQHQQQQK